MAEPIPGVKYRIKNSDFQTYIELLDSATTTTGADSVRLRPAKESDRQYWKFEKVPGYDGYYVRNVANGNQCLYFNPNGYAYIGPASTTSTIVNVTYSEGAYGLAFYYSSTNYFLYSGSVTAIYATSTKSSLESYRWQLVPVTPQSVSNYPLKTGVYRIRNLNGESLLTMPPDDKTAKDVYVRSQVEDQSPYQRWAVTWQPSGTYVIQSVGNNSYLGSSAVIPGPGDNLVGLTTSFQWDLQTVGGFAWSLSIPSSGLSIGFVDYEVDGGDEVSLVSSDATASQIWFMERYLSAGKDKIHAERELPEGKYLLQSCHNETIYMNAFGSPFRIISGTDATSQFELKYINEKSALFTLTYIQTPKSLAPLFVADVGGYIGLNLVGTEFVLLEKDKGDPGYVICRPDSGRPHKVVSGRVTSDANKRDVFAVENKTIGNEARQRWNFIPVAAK